MVVNRGCLGTNGPTGSSACTSIQQELENEQGKGAADHAKGAVNEGVGKATGNECLREEGQLDKAKGDIC